MKTTESRVVRFPLQKRSVHADFTTRVFLSIGLAIAVFFFVIWLLGAAPFDWLTILFIIGFPAVGIWAWRRASIGEVELSDSGIRVHRRTQTETYPWEDISSISLASFQDANSGLNTAVLRILGVDLAHRVAVVGLKRRARHSLFFSRIGTQTIGIPYEKEISIEPEDVTGFVEAANQFRAADGTNDPRSGISSP